jgi:hypothetical protein
MYDASTTHEDLVTRTQAADLLGVCLRTLDNLRSRGSLPEGTEVHPVDGSRHVRFHRTKLVEFKKTFWTDQDG